MRRKLISVGMLSLLVGLFSVGCEKTLFPSDTPRSQYERHQALQGQQRDAKRPDNYAGNEANIRDRLKPLDSE